ncbi:tetratricopeptide repeat protein [Gilliamella apicola]|uniref:tetratricopeptide repeat protein n=1 Tax=Gilliamella apicola TaxID=1196095 RepID=UPI002FEE3F5D
MEQQKTELDIEQRIEQLKKITRQDGAEKYAEAQFELFKIYYSDKKDCHLAIKYLSNIEKQDNPMIYACAQFNLGVIYQKKNNIEQAKQCYLNVEKQDNPEVYAQAQLNLGISYQKEKHNIEQAEHCYLNVEKQDNPEAYAQAQLNLGVIYQEVKRNFEQAKQCYLNVEKQDNPEAYAQAQLNLGVIYQEVKRNFEQAKQCYLNVENQDNPKVYAQAQLYLGVIYQNEDIKDAKECYLNIKQQDNPEVYAAAQLHLGFIYQYVDNNFELAKQYYLSIGKQDNPAAYAAAQFNLGVIYQNEDIKDAIECYLNIKQQDNPEAYAAAQLKLGFIHQNREDIEQANGCYLNVEKQDNSYIYADAQIKLGDNVFFGKTSNELKLAKKYYQNVAYSDDSFKSYIIAQIMLSVISNKNSSMFEEEQRNDLVIKISEIRKLTIYIQEELLIKFNLNESENNDGLIFERQVAHYTKPEVLFNLLKNKNKPSDFRLNVVDFMNDPTENQVLTDWLGVKTEKENEIKTFLASFSFNHNSLNQFRLYGNENNIVGSSVSLVFNKKFFGDDIKRSINPESINHLFNNTALGLPINDSAKSVVATMGVNVSNESLNHKNDKTENHLNENLDPKNSETVAEKNITSSVGSLPLFRCLYFDPKNGYISIAKRNKFSFYLEHQNNSHKGIDAKWNGYLKQLKEKEKIATIREKLNQIQDIICRLKKSRKVKKITNLDQLIALALMPISCLVKHAAFEDEDECRMIYITNIADELIQAPEDYAYANSLFVNYDKIEDYLEKIYLGPQCQPHHKLWITNHVRTSQSKTRSKPIKVVQSEMPLR